MSAPNRTVRTYSAKRKLPVATVAAASSHSSPQVSLQGGSQSPGKKWKSSSGLSSCSICGLISHATEECGLITGAEKVSDAQYPPKAILTLPSCVEYLCEGESTGNVICRSKVTKGTQFGPLDAPKATEFNTNCPYAILNFDEATGKNRWFYDTSDKVKCNWLTLVPFSSDEEKTNCVCYQMKNDIYFSVLKDLEPGTPLVVGYSKGYLRQIQKFQESTGSFSIKTSEEQTKLKDWKDHDYIHLNASRDDASNKEVLEARVEDLEYDDSGNDDVGNKKAISPIKETIRKSPRKAKPAKKNLDFSFSSDEEIGSKNFSETDDDTNVQPTSSKVSESSIKRLKKSEVIKVTEKWICKFCYKTVTDVELFTSHLIDHYKSVGWSEGEGAGDNSEIDDEDSKTAKEPSAPYTCDICLYPKEFEKLEFIIRHLTNHLAGLSRTQGSLEEERGFDNSEASTGKERDCGTCGKSFYSHARLKLHVSVNHGNLAKCKRCRRIFSTDEELKFHACRHCKCVTDGDLAVLIKCEVCEETFSKTSLFEKHAKNHDPKSFSCPICFKSLTNDARKLHGNLCLAIQNFLNQSEPGMICPCLKCDKSFRTVEHFQEHVAFHTHPLMCQRCKMRFRTPDEVQQHLCNELLCDMCHISFGNLDRLVSHIKTWHPGPYAYCFECVVPFASKEGYDKHGDCEYQHDMWLKPTEALDPTSEVGRFVCEMCGATYNKWSSMKTHRRTHGPKGYVCDQCGKSFHRRELLSDHINTHDDAKFECQECHKFFKSQRSLHVHMRIHNGVKPYSCDLCGKAFTQRVNLRVHSETHLPEDQRKFPCPHEDCDKTFATKEYLKFHMNVHEQGNSIFCDVCGKEFFRRHILNRHKRTAHGNHKFKCEYCIPPLYLRQKKNLTRHLERLHANFKEEWSQEGYIDKVFIPGDGTYSYPSVKNRISKLIQPMMLPSASSSSIKTAVEVEPEQTETETTILTLHQQPDGTTILNQDEGMTVMFSGSIQDAEGEIEIQPEEVIIEQEDQGNEIQILGIPENLDGQTSMVLLQLDNSGNYVIAFPTNVSESIQLIEELE